MRTANISAAHLALAAAIVAAAFVAACDRETSARANAQAQAAGEKIDRAAASTKETISEASRELKPKIEAAGEKISAAAEKTGAQIESATKEAATSDAAITAAVKASYVKEPNLSALKIEVDTHGGVVTLNGVVQDDAARQRAQQVASSVKGVTGVKNYLTVKQG